MKRFAVRLCSHTGRTSAILVAAALLALATWAVTSHVSQAREARTASATATQPGPGSAGMIVGRDPETGQLGLPTPEQAAELLREIAKAQVPGENPQVIQHADGSLSMQVPTSLYSYSVAQRGADGKLHMECVQGGKAADDAVRRQAAAPTRGLEVR